MAPVGDLVDIVRDQAREIARGWSGRDADPDWELVAALFDAVATDVELLRVAAEIPAPRLPALLFVAGVQRVVADHPDDPLGEYYPSAATLTSRRAVDEMFGGALASFVSAHIEEIRSHFGRRYQMNEVGRSAQIAVALGEVRRLIGPRPVALVDVGAAAGFGLHVDRYHVDLGAAGRFGPVDSPVQLRCTVAGDVPLPAGSLEVAWRLGLDAAPIDVHDADARMWLTACTPPTPESFARLAGAVEIVRTFPTPLRRADDPADVADAVASVPDDLVVVVVDSYTAVFLDDDGRRSWRSAMFGSGRDVVWVSLDPLVPLGTLADRCVQDLPVEPRIVAANRAGGVFAVLSILASISGESTGRVLATAHPSGTRMAWVAGSDP